MAALGVEVGSELLRAAALVMMGGLLTSTVLTLVFVPAMYTIFDDVQELIVRMLHRIARPRPLEPTELAALKRGPTGHPTPATGWGSARGTPTAGAPNEG